MPLVESSSLTHTFTSLESPFQCLPEYQCQLQVVAILIAAFAAAFRIGGSLIKRALDSSPAKPRVIERMREDMQSDFEFVMTSDEIWHMFCSMFVIGVQHLVGGLLILPYLLGIGEPESSARLAAIGALTEVAYDAYDTVRSLYLHYVRHSLPGGIKLLRFLVLHHQLSIGFVLPMNRWHGREVCYLHMVFNLMGAGGFALFVSHYSQMLDLTRRNDLRQMRLLAVLQFAIMFYTRVVAFLPLAFLLMRHMWKEGEWVMFAAGSVGLSVMGAFNAILMPSAHKRMVKFWRSTEADFAPGINTMGQRKGGEGADRPIKSSSDSGTEDSGVSGPPQLERQTSESGSLPSVFTDASESSGFENEGEEKHGMCITRVPSADSASPRPIYDATDKKRQ